MSMAEAKMEEFQCWLTTDSVRNYSPVALTSNIIKAIISSPKLSSEHLTRPIIFAYHPGFEVEDAIMYLLPRAHLILEKAVSTMRIMFFNFSRAFNASQPALSCHKLQKIKVDVSTVVWIIYYPTNRPQADNDFKMTLS